MIICIWQIWNVALMKLMLAEIFNDIGLILYYFHIIIYLFCIILSWQQVGM